MEPVSGFSVITLRGESDAFAAPRVRSDLATALGTEAPLVVDLTPATFIDSTIVGVLLEAKRLAAERGADYSVVLGETTGEAVRRMFEMTGLVGILPVVERDEAPG